MVANRVVASELLALWSYKILIQFFASPSDVVWFRRESNPRPTGYEPAALTTELQNQVKGPLASNQSKTQKPNDEVKSDQSNTENDAVSSTLKKVAH